MLLFRKILRTESMNDPKRKIFSKITKLNSQLNEWNFETEFPAETLHLNSKISDKK